MGHVHPSWLPSDFSLCTYLTSDPTRAKTLLPASYPVRVLPSKPSFLTTVGCDESFTRSEALAKHMRLQHNVEAGGPGGGGNRKRNRDREELSHPIASTVSDPTGFSISKVEPNTPSELQDLGARIAEQDATYANEVAALRRLVEMVEAREAKSKAIVENVEQEWVSMSVRIAVNLLCANRSSESDYAWKSHGTRAPAPPS
jgi:hypothetical protein